MFDIPNSLSRTVTCRACVPVDARVQRAADYWARQPGNYQVFRIFGPEDARQEAAIALLAEPNAKWAWLYRRIICAVRKVIPGYRQRNVPVAIELDDLAETEQPIDPGAALDEIVLTRELAARLDALPEPQRTIARHYVLGDDARNAAKANGVGYWHWRRDQKQLIQQMQTQGM